MFVKRQNGKQRKAKKITISKARQMTLFLLRREIDDCMLWQVNGQRLPDQSVVDGINSNNNQNDKGKMFYLEKEKPKIKQETKKNTQTMHVPSRKRQGKSPSAALYGVSSAEEVGKTKAKDESCDLLVWARAGRLTDLGGHVGKGLPMTLADRIASSWPALRSRLQVGTPYKHVGLSVDLGEDEGGVELPGPGESEKEGRR